ncbi:hypothetical protein [Streptomyces sp. 7-21]|jgi:hypothetical protein|uniref:hypothetical protein n=1 Tax=Streptomyces sp. 7-21 TaxID=2802283 RepID=UPI00191EC9F4|nr:hypothetical protein [Streptomyces sp. 7-21]MBL1065967.1 hypothetical protein [Streptomyces sp. 7-21]
MQRWALTVRELRGRQQWLHWDTKILGEVTGTYEQALAALYQHAVHYRGFHPIGGSSRRWVLRDGDGFIAIDQGVTRQVSSEFRVREVLWDSKAQAPNP